MEILSDKKTLKAAVYIFSKTNPWYCRNGKQASEFIQLLGETRGVGSREQRC
jgi:hypothetical protein